jgi:hypothetical protein
MMSTFGLVAAVDPAVSPIEVAKRGDEGFGKASAITGDKQFHSLGSCFVLQQSD